MRDANVRGMLRLAHSLALAHTVGYRSSSPSTSMVGIAWGAGQSTGRDSLGFWRQHPYGSSPPPCSPVVRASRLHVPLARGLLGLLGQRPRRRQWRRRRPWPSWANSVHEKRSKTRIEEDLRRNSVHHAGRRCVLELKNTEIGRASEATHSRHASSSHSAPKCRLALASSSAVCLPS